MDVRTAQVLGELRRAQRPTLVLLADRPPARSVALLSGSFDPVTGGHVAIAQAALARVALVVFVYSVRTLPKEGRAEGPLLSEVERLALLEALCGAHERFVPAVSSHGLLADQVEAADTVFPAADLYLLMGSDKVVQVLDRTWYPNPEDALERLFGRARVLYAVRSGQEGWVEEALARPRNARWRDRFHRIPIPPDAASVSSRLVRERVRRHEDVSPLVPPEARALLGIPSS